MVVRIDASCSWFSIVVAFWARFASWHAVVLVFTVPGCFILSGFRLSGARVLMETLGKDMITYLVIQIVAVSLITLFSGLRQEQGDDGDPTFDGETESAYLVRLRAEAIGPWCWMKNAGWVAKSVYGLYVAIALAVGVALLLRS